MNRISYFPWKLSRYQDELATTNEIKTRLLKLVSKKKTNEKGCWRQQEIDKKHFQQNFKDGLTTKKRGTFCNIYTKSILYLQKLTYNIRVRRDITNIANVKEFNWTSILQ